MKIVLKYGGTSVDSLEKLQKISSDIKKITQTGKKVIVVVSAKAGETNSLIELSRQVTNRPNLREVDQLISTGENKSASLLAIILISEGVKAISLTGFQAGIVTDEKFNNAFIEKVDVKKINNYLKNYDVLVITGFQGVTCKGDITTFGKGGSDTTAVALAGALGVPCKIFTDVTGVFTVDPKIFPKSKKLEKVSYDEIMEMSAGGAKVMETRSVELAKKFNVKLWIGASGEWNSEKGTCVMRRVENFEYMPIKNLTVKRDIFVIKLEFLRKKRKIMANFFEILSKYNQKIEMASLIEKSNKMVFSCCVGQENVQYIMEEIKNNKDFAGVKISLSEKRAKIMLVGSGFATHTLISKQIFELLNENNVKFENIAINELSISFIINLIDVERSVKLLSRKLDL